MKAFGQLSSGIERLYNIQKNPALRYWQQREGETRVGAIIKACANVHRPRSRHTPEEVLEKVTNLLQRVRLSFGTIARSASEKRLPVRQADALLKTAVQSNEAQLIAECTQEAIPLLRKRICDVACHIRWMIERDIPELVTMQQSLFSSHQAEEAEGEKLRWYLRQRNIIGKIAEQGTTITGFIAYRLHQQRNHVLDCVVDPTLRRRGIGMQLVNEVACVSRKKKLARVTLNTRERNLPGQLFYRDQGFRATRVRRNFYEDTEEDDFWMECQLDDEAT